MASSISSTIYLDTLLQINLQDSAIVAITIYTVKLRNSGKHDEHCSLVLVRVNLDYNVWPVGRDLLARCMLSW